MTLDEILPECKIFDIYKDHKIKLFLKKFFSPYNTYCPYIKRDLESGKYLCMYDIITDNSLTLVNEYLKYMAGDKNK